MNSIDIANQYFAAWNARDSQALVSVFAEDGTYCDPTTPGQLTGAAIAENAQSLWRAFPDLSFEIVTVAETRPGRVAAEWIMKGTNTGEFRGLPATDKTVALPGADFITVEGDKVRSVMGYFDTRAIPEQLGLQVVVQPFSLGPFKFGTSTAVQSGKNVKPGAFSITQLINGTTDEVLETRSRTRDIAKEMRSMAGFIGLITSRIGGRGVTIAAWERPDNVDQIEAQQSARPGDGAILCRGAGHKRLHQRMGVASCQRDVGSMRRLPQGQRFEKNRRRVSVRRAAARTGAVLVTSVRPLVRCLSWRHIIRQRYPDRRYTAFSSRP